MTNGIIVGSFINILRPKFRHSGDKLAFSIVAVCYSQGFRPYAAGSLAFADDALATVSYTKLGIDGWDDFEDKYAFIVFDPEHESQNKLLLKFYLQNNNTQILIQAVAAADSSRVAFLTVNIDDFIVHDYDPKSMYFYDQFKNLDSLITLINNDVLIKLLSNWIPHPIIYHGSINIAPTKPDISSATVDTRKEKPPRDHYYKCCHQSLGSKFAKMHLTDTKKKKKVNSVSVSKPYKRRSVKNNKKNNCTSGGSKQENVGLYDLPFTIYEDMKKAAGIIEHLKTFKDDKQALKELERYEFYIANSLAYHRVDWTYKRETCKEDVSKCY